MDSEEKRELQLLFIGKSSLSLPSISCGEWSIKRLIWVTNRYYFIFVVIIDSFFLSNFRYQWPPLNPLWHKILMVFMFMLGFLSFFGNGLVVYVFTTTKTLRTPSNLFVVNLAFSDFCMMFCMCPAMMVNCFNETWVFGNYFCTFCTTMFGTLSSIAHIFSRFLSLGPTACALYAMAGSLFGNTSIWTMIMIALDRYNVIVKVSYELL